MDKRYSINSIDIEVIIDSNIINPKITIRTGEKNALIDNIIAAVEEVSGQDSPLVAGYLDGGVELVPYSDIIRFRTDGRKIVMDTKNGTLSLKKSLSAIEENLDVDTFCRISQSEIINMKMVKRFDLSKAGMIAVELIDGTTTYVSRRHLKNIRQSIEKFNGGLSR